MRRRYFGRTVNRRGLGTGLLGTLGSWHSGGMKSLLEEGGDPARDGDTKLRRAG